MRRVEVCTREGGLTKKTAKALGVLLVTWAQRRKSRVTLAPRGRAKASSTCMPGTSSCEHLMSTPLRLTSMIWQLLGWPLLTNIQARTLRTDQRGWQRRSVRAISGFLEFFSFQAPADESYVSTLNKNEQRAIDKEANVMPGKKFFAATATYGCRTR